MAPKLTSGTATDGVIAYQDHADPTQFHYIPARADCILGDTLLDFDVTYWGINPAPYYVLVPPDTTPFNSVGAVLAGRARLDISAKQRANISAAIKNEFGIATPKLLPVLMDKIRIQPVIASNIVELTKNSKVTFPSKFQFGNTFAYLVDSVNSLFATLAAGTGVQPTPRPSFSVNVSGEVEFVGDPWTAEIECDLSQVWDYTRTEANVSVGWGWFSLGSASYSNIVQKLESSNIIKVTFKEGSGTKGREIFEVAKTIFERINQMAIGGEGYFKFEPNPAPQGNVGGGASKPNWWGWNVSINASYAHQSFQQSKKFKETISYTGRVPVLMSSAMVLAVACGTGTDQFFHDLQDTTHACLNQAKLDGLQNRLSQEAKAKLKKSLEYLQRLEDGVWDDEKYRRMMAILHDIALTESLLVTEPKGRGKGSYLASAVDMEGYLSLQERKIDQIMKKKPVKKRSKVGRKGRR